MTTEENENVESEGLDFNMSFLNEEDEETPQESEAEPLDDEEDDTEESEESEEELDEESEEEEVEDEEDSDEISYTPFVSPLIESGVLWVDPDKEYDDSPEGFQQILEDTANHRYQSLLESLPEEAQRVLEVIQAGESLESALEVYNSFDYEAIDLEDVDTQKELTKDYYKAAFPTWSDEKIQKRVDTLEDLDELGEEAIEAQKFFVEKTAAEKEAYYEQVQARQAEAVERQQAEYNEYVKLINESEGFRGINFSSNAQKNEFHTYAFVKGEDGLTQYERETQTPKSKLEQAWIEFNKTGMDTIERKATTKASLAQQKILKRLGKQDKNASSGKSYADVQTKKDAFFIPTPDMIK